MSNIEKKGLTLAGGLFLCLLLVSLASWSIAEVTPHDLLKLLFSVFLTSVVMFKAYKLAEKYFNSEIEKEDDNRKK